MTLPPSPRTEVKRLPARSRYDSDVVHRILDEALICHVGFVVDGQPVVIPTIHARQGDRLYLHGSPASRMLRTLKREVDVCVTVTLVDGLVPAGHPSTPGFNDPAYPLEGRPTWSPKAK